jgi:hypothetical protein
VYNIYVLLPLGSDFLEFGTMIRHIKKETIRPGYNKIETVEE